MSQGQQPYHSKYITVFSNYYCKFLWIHTTPGWSNIHTAREGKEFSEKGPNFSNYVQYF